VAVALPVTVPAVDEVKVTAHCPLAFVPVVLHVLLEMLKFDVASLANVTVGFVPVGPGA
jgi:hypothetical protein